MSITYWFFHKANGLSKDANWSNGIPKEQCVNATISQTLLFWWGRTLRYEQLKHDLNRFFLKRGEGWRILLWKNTNGLDARSNVCFLFFVEIRRRAFFKNNVLGWSCTFNRFCSNDFHNLHSDMEVQKTNRNEILSSVYHQWNNELLYFFFRFIKSDQNIMMLNLCASLVLAYVVFISSVEQTDNEVHQLTFIKTIICATN